MKKNGKTRGIPSRGFYTGLVCTGLLIVHVTVYTLLYFFTGPPVNLLYTVITGIAAAVSAGIAAARHRRSANEPGKVSVSLTRLLDSSFRLATGLHDFTDYILSGIITCFTGNGSCTDNRTREKITTCFTAVQNAGNCFREPSEDLQKTENPSAKSVLSHWESYNACIDHYLEALRNVRDCISGDLERHSEADNRVKLLPGLLIEFSISARLVGAFLDSIISNSSKTGEKVSGQIVDLKKNIDQFMGKITDWKENFLEKTSKLNFDTLMERYREQKKDFGEITNHISANYNDLNRIMNSFVESVTTINHNIRFINEIADSINILAINASIEAARQGKTGRGFKVIAGEIKNLSARTESFIRNIEDKIEEAGSSINLISSNYNESTHILLEQIENQREKIDVSYDMLKTYYDNFNIMIASMSRLTDNTGDQINKFNIILQHYDIEEQELNNLKKIISFCEEEHKEYIEELAGAMTGEYRQSIIRKIMERTNALITTRLENRTLHMLMNELGFTHTGQKEEEEEPDIELF